LPRPELDDSAGRFGELCLINRLREMAGEAVRPGSDVVGRLTERRDRHDRNVSPPRIPVQVGREREAIHIVSEGDLRAAVAKLDQAAGMAAPLRRVKGEER